MKKYLQINFAIDSQWYGPKPFNHQFCCPTIFFFQIYFFSLTDYFPMVPTWGLSWTKIKKALANHEIAL